MNYTLDRFEGEYAILVDKKNREYDVLIEDLPSGAREGDMLFDDGGNFVFNEEATKEQREKLENIRANIVKKY